MIALLHSLKVVTFATWSSLVVFGGVGLLVEPETPISRPREVILMDAEALDDVELNASSDTDAGGSADIAQGSEEPASSPATDAIAPPPPTPDFVVDSTLPDLPALVPPPAPAKQSSTTPASAVAESQKPALTRRGKTDGKGQTAFGQVGGKGMGEGTGTSTASGNGNSDRTRRRAGLIIPKPNYPSTCRNSGIVGTVKVRIKWDADGNLVSADVIQSSSSPQLDEAAVKACRRARFPKGDPDAVVYPVRFSLID